ncbi:PAS domain S-box protein, partial [Hydrogenovibrio marinus]
MIQSQKKTLYNDRFIKYGKYVILIFVISLLTLATFLFQKTNQIKHRDLILNNTIELIGEEIDFSKSVIFFSEDHQLDSQALTKHTLNIQKLLTEIQSHDHDTPQINNALFKLEQTVNSLKEFMSEFNLLFRQISQSRIQFQRELEQCQDHLSTSTQRNALSDLIHANQLSLLAIKTDTIDHFENTTNRFENTVTIDACKPLIFQSRQLIDLQQRLSGVYHQIIDLPLKENILSVHALYQTETNNDVKLSFWYNLTLVIISLLFLTFISLSLYRLFHVNKNLVITLEDLEQQKNIYHALSEANHAASALATKEEIYQTITDIIIRYIRIPSCWVAVKQLNSNWVNPVAMSGIGQEVLSNIQVSVDPNIPEGQGAVGIAYRTKKAVIQNDYSLTESSRPWFSEAMKWGIHSLAAFPIMRGKDVEAIIVFYALKPNFFNKKVVKIIQELIDEVSLALERLRFREAEQAHQTSQNISAIAFESQESIIITDKDAKILKTNQAFTEMTGYTESEVFGRRPDMLRSSKHPLSFYDDIWKTVTKTGRWNGETWSRRKDGTEYQVYQTITAVFDDNQKITNYILHRIDITQSKQAESEISYLKNHDDLTGLANRSFLKQKIEQFLLQEQQANVSFNVILVIVNIKRFKTLNETLGHLAGDEILIETANRLKNIQLKDS